MNKELVCRIESFVMSDCYALIFHCNYLRLTSLERFLIHRNQEGEKMFPFLLLKCACSNTMKQSHKVSQNKKRKLIKQK